MDLELNARYKRAADASSLQTRSGVKDLIKQMLVIDPVNRGKLSELLDGFDGVLRAATSKQIEIDGFAF